MADNIYVNVTMANTSNNTTSQATTSIAYDTALIDDPTQYYMSVVKMEIPLQGVPLFVFPTPGLGNDWIIGMVNAGTAYPQTVPFVSFNGFNNSSSFNYYYVYHYDQLIVMINRALYDSWVAAGSPAGGAPYISFNAESGLFSIIQNKPQADLGWNVYWNNNFNIYFPSFGVNLINIDSTAANARYILTCEQKSYDVTYTVGTNYVIPQNNPSVDYLNSIRKIILMSNSLPVRKEIYPPSIGSLGSSNNNSIPIITDFQLEVNNIPGQQRSILTYSADTLRLVDLINNSPINRLDLTLFWADSLNNLYPLYITKSDSVTIKLGFFKKSLFKHS